MKFILILLLIVHSYSGTCQQEYVIQKDLPYYANTEIQGDAYKTSQCLLDIYYPKDGRNFATIIWFHGGGITGGQKEIPKALMEKGYAVIGVGYRLSPKVNAPVYIEDAAAAVAWTFQNIRKYGGNTDLIFVSGHSAGGYLGMMIGLDKKYLNNHSINADQIAGIIPFSGQAVTHFTIRKERGIKDTQPTIDDLAPLYHVRAGAPPLLLITGDREMELLGRYEENAYLARMMQLTGHTSTKLYELQGFDHGNMPEPAFPLLLREVRDISKKILSKK